MVLVSVVFEMWLLLVLVFLLVCVCVYGSATERDEIQHHTEKKRLWIG